jgi:hypothetical protein
MGVHTQMLSAESVPLSCSFLLASFLGAVLIGFRLSGALRSLRSNFLLQRKKARYQTVTWVNYIAAQVAKKSHTQAPCKSIHTPVLQCNAYSGLGISSIHEGTSQPDSRMTFTMVRRLTRSRLVKKVIASPGLPARPVRPEGGRDRRQASRRYISGKHTSGNTSWTSRLPL